MTKAATHEYVGLAPLFAELAEARDERERARIRDELVTGHLPLALHIAHRYHNRGVADDDLEQVATLGLIQAVDRFDPMRGVDFLSFAVPTITGEVRRYFRDFGWPVRMPRRLKELHLALSAASGQIYQRLGRAPRPSELAAELGLPVDEVIEGLCASTAHTSVSIDRPVGDETGEAAATLADVLGEDDPALRTVDDVTDLRAVLARLPERERRILTMRFHGNLTQSEIAERVGLSQMHVSRLLTRTLAQLREQLARD